MQQAFHFSIVAQLIVEKNVFNITLMYFNILTSMSREWCNCVTYKKFKSEKNLAPFGTQIFFKIDKKKVLSTLEKCASYCPYKKTFIIFVIK